MLEGRPWMQKCIDIFKAKIVEEPKQKSGYYYIYQPFTTCFIQFKSLDILKECIEFLNSYDSYWDYDGYVILESKIHKHFMECQIKIKED